MKNKNPEHLPKNPVDTPKNSLRDLREQISETPKDIARIEAFAGLRDQQLALVEMVKKNIDLPQRNDIQKLEARLVV